MRVSILTANSLVRGSMLRLGGRVWRVCTLLPNLRMGTVRFSCVDALDGSVRFFELEKGD